MRIDAIEIYHVAMPLLYPWRTAYGEDAAVESMLVRLEARDGSGRRLSAWGESSPLAAPCYSPEWAGGVFVVLSLLWGCAILFSLYGVLGFVEKLLMGLGALAVPDGLGEDVVWWYVFLWEPIWILGGVA